MVSMALKSYILTHIHKVSAGFKSHLSLKKVDIHSLLPSQLNVGMTH